MLTIPVNIAVFATFSFCVEGDLLSDAAFKPVCAIWQLDVARYGRQKWQDPATKWQGGWQKREDVGGNCHIHAIAPGVALGGRCPRLPRYGVVQVPAALDNTVMIELKYHKEGAVSRW